MQSAADDTGLPMLVVRAPFNLVWQRLPGALEKVGMKVTDSTRSQGSMALTYKPLSDSSWQELGARDPQLVSGDYKLQVGDLDNRSSLQFIDPKGHTLTQSQNDALVAGENRQPQGFAKRAERLRPAPPGTTGRFCGSCAE